MLEFMQIDRPKCEPPILFGEDLNYICIDGLPDNIGPYGDYFVITKTKEDYYE